MNVADSLDGGRARGLVRSLRRGEQGYPDGLLAIHDPPQRIYLRGARPDLLEGCCVAVVGARSCSGYGARVSRSLARELAAAGAVVVSGLARGIDAEAHRGALEAGGATVAVLGCGIDRDYPRANAALAAQIERDGLIVSEYPAGVEPAPWRFPARNRVIAGLSLVTVVVEARARSGALLTADFALEQGREVLAVPGEITSALSEGTNGLLRQGAAPMLGAADVLDLLPLEQASHGPDVPAAPDHPVWHALAGGIGEEDAIVRAVALPAAEVAAALVELELAGLAWREDGRWRPAPPRPALRPSRPSGSPQPGLAS